jgi:hypothetical protein
VCDDCYDERGRRAHAAKFAAHGIEVAC